MSNPVEFSIQAPRSRSVKFAAKVKAYDLYVNQSNLTVAEIAKEIGMNHHTLIQWIHKGRWTIQRQAIAQEIAERAQAATVKFQAENRLKVLQKHMTVGTAFETEVERKLKQIKDSNTPMDARSLADMGKALQAGTTVTARAVGIDQQVQVNIAPKVNFLINTNINPVEPDSTCPAPKTIDVAVEPSEPDPF
jgi:phage antirepressor YoqD-like protein